MEQAEDAVTALPTASVGVARMGVGVLVCITAAAYFVRFFSESHWQPTVDLAWLVACLAWCAAFWSRDRSSLPRLPQPYWFYALYAVCLLPYATNWRWAMTGDTLSWLFMGVDIADHGLSRSILSARGPDQFSHFQMLIHNCFMILVAPTIFWARVGKIMVAVAAAASIYTVFARLVRPSFGLLVTACTVACPVWIVYVHSPFPYYDGVASGFTLLALALWVRRDPYSHRAWLLLGSLSGLMMYLTMNGWFMAMLVWVWMTGLVLRRRAPVRLYLLAIVAGLIVGGPMLIQWLTGSSGSQFDLVQRPHWTLEKVQRFGREAALMPFQSDLFSNGAFGPQLPYGFRWLFPPGVLFAVLFFRSAPASRLMLVAYAIHLTGLVFTQGPYESVSPKRALILIPMATYFCFLPFQRWIRSTWVVLPIALVWAFLGVHEIATRVAPGVLGYTLLDGVVEAHQRMSDAEKICIYLPGDARSEALRTGGGLDRLYNIHDHLVVVDDPNHPACKEALCYCSQEDRKHVDLAAHGYTPLPLLNSNELRCGRRLAAAPGNG